MGHGAPRTLSSDDDRPIEPLTGELATRVERAFTILEAKDEDFKQNREDERHQQLSKAWNNRCGEIVEELRHLGRVIVSEHQVLCDCGQEGAGVTTAPFLEEAMGRFPKLQIRLKGTNVVAECDGHELHKAENMAAVDYPWLERAATEWIVWAITNRT